MRSSSAKLMSKLVEKSLRLSRRPVRAGTNRGAAVNGCSLSRGALVAVVLAPVLAGCSLTSNASNPGSWGSSFGDPNTQVAGSEANAAISVLVNNELGNALTPSDRAAAEEAQNRALRARGTGASINWQNPSTGRSGKVMPGPVYSVNETRCREFKHEMVFEGNQLNARGTACETSRGNWQVIG